MKKESKKLKESKQQFFEALEIENDKNWCKVFDKIGGAHTIGTFKQMLMKKYVCPVKKKKLK